jgi:chromosome segregation ATPase
MSVMAIAVALLYVRYWGKRHVSEGKSEESDAKAHGDIAEAVKAALMGGMEQLAARDTRIDAQGKQITDLYTSVTQLTVENAEIRAQREAEKSMAAEMRATLLAQLDKAEAARAQERLEMIEERRRLEDKIDQLNRANGAHREHAQAMDDRVSKLESEVDQYRAQHERAERENSQLKATVAEQDTEIKALKVENKELRTEVEVHKAEIKRLRTEFENMYSAENAIIEHANGTSDDVTVYTKKDTGRLNHEKADAANDDSAIRLPAGSGTGADGNPG